MTWICLVVSHVRFRLYILGKNPKFADDVLVTGDWKREQRSSPVRSKWHEGARHVDGPLEPRARARAGDSSTEQGAGVALSSSCLLTF